MGTKPRSVVDCRLNNTRYPKIDAISSFSSESARRGTYPREKEKKLSTYTYIVKVIAIRNIIVVIIVINTENTRLFTYAALLRLFY